MSLVDLTENSWEGGQKNPEQTAGLPKSLIMLSKSWAAQSSVLQCCQHQVDDVLCVDEIHKNHGGRSAEETGLIVLGRQEKPLAWEPDTGAL